MFRIPSIMCHALALSLAAGTVTPLAAAPAFMPNAPAVTSQVIDVQNRRDDRRWDRRNDRRWDNRRDNRRPDRFERRGNQAYWRGHRGYRHARPGYRQHNGWWFPPAAFIAGAIIGGAVNQPGTRVVSSDHVRWCQNRWRSYRVSDNSYQPYNGPRRQCVSPFG